MVFGGFLLLEAVHYFIVLEGLLGVSISVAGWFIYHKGTTTRATLATWIRCFALGLPVLLATYVVAYLVLMDRSRPTAFSAYRTYFESSLRMAPNEWDSLARRPSAAPQVTILNLVFRPADGVYFRLFPRSDEELNRRFKSGYFP
jgi:hypothetical protein